MLIADFLSRHPDNDTDNPHEVIPISFQAKDEFKQVITRSQAKKQAEATKKVPEASQGHLGKPAIAKKTAAAPVQKGEAEVHHLTSYTPMTYGVPVHDYGHGVHSNIENLHPEARYPNRHSNQRKEFANNHPTLEEFLNPIPVDITFTGNVPVPGVHSDELIDCTVPAKFKQQSHPLFPKGEVPKFTRPFMPKQQEFERVIRKLATSVLKTYNLPIIATEIAASYPKSPYYKDIFGFLKTGIMPPKTTTHKMKRLCADYAIINNLLFKLILDNMGQPSLVLCIPEKYIPMVLYQYHDFVLAGHQGVARTLKTIREKFHFPEMAQYINKYIASCHTCQEAEKEQNLPTSSHVRIPLSFRPFDRMGMDIKIMVPSPHMQFTQLLVCTCEITNWVVGIPLAKADTETIFEAVYQRIVCVYGAPSVIISDQQTSMTSKLMQELYKRLRMKPLYVSQENHGSNRTERYIQTINKRMCRYLKGEGKYWPYFVAPCTFAMNTFVSPVTGFSPYELMYIRKPPSLTEIEASLESISEVSADPGEYMKLMQKKANFVKTMIYEEKTRQQQLQHVRMLRGNADAAPIEKGDLIMIHRPLRGALKTQRKNVSRPWVGPAKVCGIPGPTRFLVSDLSGSILPVLVHRKEIKPYNARIFNKDLTILEATQEVEAVLKDMRTDEKVQNGQGKSSAQVS